MPRISTESPTLREFGPAGLPDDRRILFLEILGPPWAWRPENIGKSAVSEGLWKGLSRFGLDVVDPPPRDKMHHHTSEARHPYVRSSPHTGNHTRTRDPDGLTGPHTAAPHTADSSTPHSTPPSTGTSSCHTYTRELCTATHTAHPPTAQPSTADGHVRLSHRGTRSVPTTLSRNVAYHRPPLATTVWRVSEPSSSVRREWMQCTPTVTSPLISA